MLKILLIFAFIVSCRSLPPESQTAEPVGEQSASRTIVEELQEPLSLGDTSEVAAVLQINGAQNQVFVRRGEDLKLDWRSANARTCHISPGHFNATMGSAVFPNIQSSALFVLYCEGENGVAIATLDLQVMGQTSSQEISSSLKLNGQETDVVLKPEQPLIVEWETAGAEHCVLFPGAIEDSLGVLHLRLNAPKVFVLACSGSGGHLIKTATVNFHQEKNHRFTFARESLTEGESLELDQSDTCFSSVGKNLRLRQPRILTARCQSEGKPKVYKAIALNPKPIPLTNNPTEACLFVANGSCPKNMAVFGVLESSETEMIGWCCPLPASALTDKHSFTLESCGENSVLTGFDSGEFRCSAVNQRYFSLADETPTHRVDPDRSGVASPLSFVVGRPRNGPFNLGETEWYWENVCLGERGAVLTSYKRGPCDGIKARRLLFKESNEGKLTEAKIFPQNCRTKFEAWQRGSRVNIKIDEFDCDEIPKHWVQASLQQPQ